MYVIPKMMYDVCNTLSVFSFCGVLSEPLNKPHLLNETYFKEDKNNIEKVK